MYVGTHDTFTERILAYQPAGTSPSICPPPVFVSEPTAIVRALFTPFGTREISSQSLAVAELVGAISRAAYPDTFVAPRRTVEHLLD